MEGIGYLVSHLVKALSRQMNDGRKSKMNMSECEASRDGIVNIQGHLSFVARRRWVVSGARTGNGHLEELRGFYFLDAAIGYE